MNSCPYCHQSLPTLTICGRPYRAVKKTIIKPRYIDAGENEVKYVLPIPLLVVKVKNREAEKKPETIGDQNES